MKAIQTQRKIFFNERGFGLIAVIVFVMISIMGIVAYIAIRSHEHSLVQKEINTIKHRLASESLYNSFRYRILVGSKEYSNWKVGIVRQLYTETGSSWALNPAYATHVRLIKSGGTETNLPNSVTFDASAASLGSNVLSEPIRSAIGFIYRNIYFQGTIWTITIKGLDNRTNITKDEISIDIKGYVP